MDIFEKLQKKAGPLGQHADDAYGYYMFPRLEGAIGPRMTFRGKPMLNWSLNNYLGLANNPDLIRAAQQGLDSHGFGVASVRFICGTQDIHKELEQKISGFLGTEDTILYSSC